MNSVILFVIPDDTIGNIVLFWSQWQILICRWRLQFLWMWIGNFVLDKFCSSDGFTFCYMKLNVILSVLTCVCLYYWIFWLLCEDIISLKILFQFVKENCCMFKTINGWLKRKAGNYKFDSLVRLTQEFKGIHWMVYWITKP